MISYDVLCALEINMDAFSSTLKLSAFYFTGKYLPVLSDQVPYSLSQFNTEEPYE